VDILMTSLVASVLYVVAFVWVVLMVWIATDRYRHERRISRMAALKQRLYRSSPGDVSALRTIVSELTIAQLDALILEGLPLAMEIAVATSMHERSAELLRDARGAGSVWQRISAVRVLAAARSDRRYELLDTMLRSGTPVLGAASIRILAKIDTRQSANLLIKALRAGVYSRSRVAAAIDTMSVSRADMLQTLFDAAEPEVLFWAVKLAGRLKAREWTSRVRQLAIAADPLVRRAAVEALGSLGDATDLTLLVRGMRDPLPFVRAHAVRACVRFADGDTIDALVGLLADRHWMVRAAARDALARIGTAALPAVKQALWHSDRFAADSAAEILHRTGGAAEAARQILEDAGAARRQSTMLTRFLAVAGPSLRAAFLGQLTTRERRVLMGHLEPASGTAE
jgi:HEAT repeat protein